MYMLVESEFILLVTILEHTTLIFIVFPDRGGWGDNTIPLN